MHNASVVEVDAAIPNIRHVRRIADHKLFDTLVEVSITLDTSTPRIVLCVQNS